MSVEKAFWEGVLSGAAGTLVIIGLLVFGAG